MKSVSIYANRVIVLFKYYLLLILFTIFFLCTLTSFGATYSVSNTADAGAGSLRQAITSANATIGVADVIDFSALGAGTFTITLASALPVITDQLTIDGYTAASYTANNPKIEIQCAFGVILDFSGANANGSIVRGVILNKGTQYGIRFDNVKNGFITGCWIGLTNTGTVPAVGNEITLSGIYLTNNSNTNTIGGTTIADRNVIGGTKDNGISIANTSINTTILGNYIGIAPNGLTAVGNTSAGIKIDGCNGTTIGGTTIKCRNIISGNKVNGIYVINGSTSTIVKANFVGLDKTGATAVGNTDHGIWFNGASSNTIGGTTFAERNVVSGNGKPIGTGNGNGLSFDGSNNNVVKGNWSGVDSTGLVAVPNNQGGISFWNCANNTVGGTTQYERNIFSGNVNEGLFMGGGSTLNTIIGNYIGVGSDGVTSIGNQKFGLNLFPDINTSTIGGSLANANIIANNGFIDAATTNMGPGISLDGGNSNKNLMTYNKIYCNAGVAIKITNSANNGIVPPVITSSTANTVMGTGVTGNTIHIYRNGNIGGPGCDCEAEIYLGNTVVAGGTWSFTHSLGLTTGPTGQASYVTATQTDVSAPVNNTSALAPCNTTPLPVALLSFDLIKNNSNIIVEWKTASEINNNYYIIERSCNGFDFEEVGRVKGAGTTGSISSYSFTDYTPLNGLAYYRLKQVDYNGNSSHSTIKTTMNGDMELTVLPNPSTGIFLLGFYKNKTENCQVKIINLIGQEIYKTTIGSGDYILQEIDLSFVETGVYIVKVQTENNSLTQKITKY